MKDKSIKKITIKEIIKNKYVNWKDVKRAIKYHYPNDKNDYEELFYTLGKKRVSKVEDGWWLVIKGGVDFYADWFEDGIKKMIVNELLDEEITEWYDISLRKDGEDMSYSCSFQPWNKMINYPIDKETLRNITLTEIVAHFIWEITFYGNEEDMKRKGNDLKKMIKDIKKD